MRIGVALSGGGARGIAHLGVLQALEELDLKPSVISGVSSGAIMGVFYCAGMKPKEILSIINEYNFFGFSRILWQRAGLYKNKAEAINEKFLKGLTFEDLKTRLFVSATDVLKGKTIYFSSGGLYLPILASFSMPVLFKPVEMDGKVLLDGGLINNLPIEPLAAIADKVIGVHVNPINTNIKTVSLRGLIDRSCHLALRTNVRVKIHQCDVFIEPPQLMHYAIFETRATEEIFNVGYSYAMSIKNQLLQLAA